MNYQKRLKEIAEQAKKDMPECAFIINDLETHAQNSLKAHSSEHLNAFIDTIHELSQDIITNQ